MIAPIDWMTRTRTLSERSDLGSSVPRVIDACHQPGCRKSHFIRYVARFSGRTAALRCPQLKATFQPGQDGCGERYSLTYTVPFDIRRFFAVDFVGRGGLQAIPGAACRPGAQVFKLPRSVVGMLRVEYDKLHLIQHSSDLNNASPAGSGPIMNFCYSDTDVRECRPWL